MLAALSGALPVAGDGASRRWPRRVGRFRSGRFDGTQSFARFAPAAGPAGLAAATGSRGTGVWLPGVGMSLLRDETRGSIPRGCPTRLALRRGVGHHRKPVVERLGQTDPAGQITVAVPGTGHTSDVVSVPMAELNWTVSPRFELGYRLPSGFGEVDVAYRFLLAEGTVRRRPARWPAPTRPPR